MLSNKVKNFRNFKLNVKLNENLKDENSIIENIKGKISKIDVNGVVVKNEITLLKKNNELLFLVECRAVNVLKREKYMYEFFEFITIDFFCEFSIDSIQINEFKSILLNCYVSSWELIEFPKYIQTT